MVRYQGTTVTQHPPSGPAPPMSRPPQSQMPPGGQHHQMGGPYGGYPGHRGPQQPSMGMGGPPGGGFMQGPGSSGHRGMPPPGMNMSGGGGGGGGQYQGGQQQAPYNHPNFNGPGGQGQHHPQHQPYPPQAQHGGYPPQHNMPQQHMQQHPGQQYNQQHPGQQGHPQQHPRQHQHPQGHPQHQQHNMQQQHQQQQHQGNYHHHQQQQQQQQQQFGQPNYGRQSSGPPSQQNQSDSGGPLSYTQPPNANSSAGGDTPEGDYGQQFLPTGLNGDWQSDRDMHHRREMIQHIVKLLKQKDKNASPEWLTKLPQMVKQLEVSLYRSAPSFAAYSDTSTLKHRLQQLAMEIARKTQQAKNESGSGADRRKSESQRSMTGNDGMSRGGSRGSMSHSGPMPQSGSSNQGMGGNMMGGGNSGGMNNSMSNYMRSGGGNNEEDRDLIGSSTQHGNPNDPEWKVRIRHKQQRLLLLHHSSKCPYEDGKCKVTPYCGDMKKLWKHMARCTDNECRVPHCFSSRSILSHYRKCKDPRCPACGPVRDTVRKTQKNTQRRNGPNDQSGDMGNNFDMGQGGMNPMQNNNMGGPGMNNNNNNMGGPNMGNNMGGGPSMPNNMGNNNMGGNNMGNNIAGNMGGNNMGGNNMGGNNVNNNMGANNMGGNNMGNMGNNIGNNGMGGNNMGNNGMGGNNMGNNMGNNAMGNGNIGNNMSNNNMANNMGNTNMGNNMGNSNMGNNNMGNNMGNNMNGPNMANNMGGPNIRNNMGGQMGQMNAPGDGMMNNPMGGSMKGPMDGQMNQQGPMGNIQQPNSMNNQFPPGQNKSPMWDNANNTNNMAMGPQQQGNNANAGNDNNSQMGPSSSNNNLVNQNGQMPGPSPQPPFQEAQNRPASSEPNAAARNGASSSGQAKNDSDSSKSRHKQQRLLLLRHASKCTHPDGQCPVTPHCAEMKVLWKHIASCKDNYCKIKHCMSSRYVLSHYRRCKDSTCEICAPVREIIKNGVSNVINIDAHFSTGSSGPSGSSGAAGQTVASSQGGESSTPSIDAALMPPTKKQKSEHQPNAPNGVNGPHNSDKPDDHSWMGQRPGSAAPRPGSVGPRPGSEGPRPGSVGSRPGSAAPMSFPPTIDPSAVLPAPQSSSQASTGPPPSSSSMEPLVSSQSGPTPAPEALSSSGAPPSGPQSMAAPQVGSTQAQVCGEAKPAPDSAISSADNKVKKEPVAPQKPQPSKPVPPPTEDHSLLECFTTEEIQTHIESLRKTVQMPPAKLKSKCLEILKGLQTHEHGWVFAAPVDPVELGLDDYFDIIKKPMDLGTIQKKIEAGSYHSFDDFKSDVRLTFENAMKYNEEKTVVHEMAKELKKKFDSDYKKLMKDLDKEHEECRQKESACTLCGGEKLLFEPPVFFCNGLNCPSKRIRRNTHFYITSDKQYAWCNQCFNDLGGEIDLGTTKIKKEDLKKRKNDETHEESWVQCDDCERWIHQICGLYNTRQDKENKSVYSCPLCMLEKRKKHGDESLPQSPSASDIPRTKLSDWLEKDVHKKVKQRLKELAQEKAETENTSFDDAFKSLSSGGPVTIRQVTSTDRKHEVRERMKQRYAHKNYPEEFPYRCKCIVVFQNIDGVDVVLFALYVYEHGDDNPYPNKKTVYVSYLDSVHFMKPRKMRTFIYHEILISYLDYARQKGFAQAFIWACPPLKGDDYIFYAKPEDQKTPKDVRLRQWYLDMLVECQKRSIVGMVSNMYDQYFSNKKLDASSVPYFEGDYFPGEAENIIKMLEEGGGKKSSSSGKKKKKDSNKSKRNSLNDGNEPVENVKSYKEGGRDEVMQKFCDAIQGMKESFIIAFLNSKDAKPEHRVVPKEIMEFREANKMLQAPDDALDALTSDISSDPQSRKRDINGNEIVSSKEKQVDRFGRPIKVIDDDAEEIDCEFFNSRQCFLDLCRGNHYQFDELRRAKHTSMMVLWHLQNREAPKFVQQCFSCNREISSGVRHHCNVCSDFDLCDECFKNPNANRGTCTHKLEVLKVETGQDQGGVSGLTEEQRRERQRNIQLHITLIEHASRCNSSQCKSSNCQKMKQYLKHGQTCQVKASGGCKICKRIWTLLRIHAQQCKNSNCPIPQCIAIRKRIRQLQQKQQAMDDRRRQEMNRHYRMGMMSS